MNISQLKLRSEKFDDDNDNNNNVPNSVVTNQGSKVTILWNQQVQTDRTIPNNKPDIIIRDNEKRTCMLIDVAIPGEKIRVIPIIIGVSETISKSFRKYVNNIPGNHDIYELQKTAILGTAHILQKVRT